MIQDNIEIDIITFDLLQWMNFDFIALDSPHSLNLCDAKSLQLGLYRFAYWQSSP
jgi:hypothetical protein